MQVNARPAPSDTLEEFQNRVRLRAAKVQKEMREKQLEQQKQVTATNSSVLCMHWYNIALTHGMDALQMQAKKESLDRRKAYARRVSVANTEAFRKVCSDSCDLDVLRQHCPSRIDKFHLTS